MWTPRAVFPAWDLHKITEGKGGRLPRPSAEELLIADSYWLTDEEETLFSGGVAGTWYVSHPPVHNGSTNWTQGGIRNTFFKKERSTFVVTVPWAWWWLTPCYNVPSIMSTLQRIDSTWKDVHKLCGNSLLFTYCQMYFLIVNLVSSVPESRATKEECTLLQCTPLLSYSLGMVFFFYYHFWW